jgi:F-type H+-transporting ATPase subunit delta
VASASPALAAEAERLFAEAAGRGTASQVAGDLAAFASLLGTQVRLRKALADPGLPPEPKRALLAELGQGRLDRASVELLAGAAAVQRIGARHLPELVAELAARAAFAAADRDGELDRVEDELFRFAALVEREPALRSALTDPGLPVERKRALVADLAGGRASRRSASLLDLLVELGEGHDLARSAKAWAELAAGRRDRAVAEVRTAVPLDAERQARLAEALTRVTGRPVDLRLEVDEAILGSVVVRIGDEVLDGSVRNRLQQAREELGVA